MELWLDTLDEAAIQKANDLGLLFGVTTNPSILAKSKVAAEETLENLLAQFTGPLAVQVTLKKTDEMIEQAKDLYDFSPRIIVKIPATEEGFQAMAALSRLQIPTMATTILEPIQGFMAAKVGARYLAPYFSHMGENSLLMCASLQQMLNLHKLSSKLLIAALRTPAQVYECILQGFSAVTLKESLFWQCLEVPREVYKHLDKFAEDWKEAPFSNLFAPPQLIK